jgi:Uma2 family endonuclease
LCKAVPMVQISQHAKQILSRPDALEQVRAMQAILEEEARKRHEFREWLDEDIKAEFINGEIVMHSPVKKRHWQASDFLSRLLSVYTGINDLGQVGVEKVMIELTRNDYEPDICFFSKEKASAFTDDQMLFPAPDLVVEILSKKTTKKDRGIKKEDYAAHGIREYWIIDPIKQIVEQYFLIDEHSEEYFQPYIYRIDDDISSRVLEGFTIPIRAIFEQKANVEALKKLV